MEVISIESKAYKQFMEELHEVKSELLKKQKQLPLNEVWLDNSEVCQLLHISKRTLQAYRDKKTIPFSQIGAKIYYKASDIQDHLEKNYTGAGPDAYDYLQE